jgi:hypothetical protein
MQCPPAVMASINSDPFRIHRDLIDVAVLQTGALLSLTSRVLGLDRLHGGSHTHGGLKAFG